MPTRVVHCKREDYDIYIGRGSIFGNPFKITSILPREDAIDLFEIWLSGRLDEYDDFYKALRPQREALLKALPKLKGKTLGCWCAPKPCHGDVLARMADELP